MRKFKYIIRNYSRIYRCYKKLQIFYAMEFYNKQPKLYYIFGCTLSAYIPWKFHVNSTNMIKI